MSKTIKIDLDKKEHVNLLNPSAVARLLGVTPQYAGRVLRGRQSSKKLKEQFQKMINPDKAA
jgi:hypothetical protein